MCKKKYIFLEMVAVLFFILIILKFSGLIVNLMGYNSKLRYFLICFVPASMAILPFCICKVKRKDEIALDYSNNHFFVKILLALFSVVILLIITVMIPLILGKELYQLVGQPYYETKIIIFRLFYYLIVVGFSEEYIFRGYFFHRLKEIFDNEWYAIIGSSLMFGIMHYINSQSIYLVIETCLAGMFYSVLAHKTKYGNLWVSSLSHGLYDAILMLIASFML